MSLEDIPQAFADYFVINLTSAQVILSIVVIFAVLLPVMILTKGKTLTIYLMTFLLVECLLVGIGWLSYWILIVSVVILALGFAKFGGDMVTGGG